MDLEKMQKEVERLKDHFDAIDKKREVAYHDARELRRISVQAVRDIHRKKFDSARELIEQGREIAGRLIMNNTPFGFLDEAHQEYSEAALTLAFLAGEEPPSVDDLRTTARGYLLGMSDTVGEIRRHVLNLLTHDKMEEAKQFMGIMDEIFGMLQNFDHTDAVIPIRRKQDAIRGIIERTRGDLTNIVCQKRLESCIRGGAANND